MRLTPPRWLFLLLVACPASPLWGQDGADLLIPAGVTTDLPLVVANDNRAAAGVEDNGLHTLDLVVTPSAWHPEGPDGPGLKVAAISEGDGPPSIPSPLIRVEEDTRLRVTVTNQLAEPIQVFGLHSRPASELPGVGVPAGATEVFEFDAGTPGTYMYYVQPGDPAEESEGPVPEREQLAGAFIVDPVGGSPPDRVFVMNIFSEFVGPEVAPGWAALEGLGVNGMSFPFTERQKLEVGAPVRWRIINASIRVHPMHLHGFYYDVTSRGTATADTVYADRDRRAVVTELMRGRTTMTMEWTPTRPGTWLFHCHLSFHVTAQLRLPTEPGVAQHHEDSHMAGLVLGIEVADGPSDLVFEGEPVEIDLYANEVGQEKGYRYAFTLSPNTAPKSTDDDTPGPPLILQQYQPADITVHNRLSTPTGVHWHGLELDAWADGVPGYSASDGRVSPAIAPGESFTYRIATMRPGTFIYHSHLNDIDQLTGGLYGPLIVLPEGETFDPRTDHMLVMGWRTPEPRALEDVELNGRNEQPTGRARVGETHRFRVMNIGPAGGVSVWLRRDEEPVSFRLLAKDGADLPEHQRVLVDMLPRMEVGETADFTWTPEEAGTYVLMVGPNPNLGFRQRWEVQDP